MNHPPIRPLLPLAVAALLLAVGLGQVTAPVSAFQSPLPQLAFDKSVSDAAAEVGEPLTYTLTITNNGGYKDELVLVDDLPPEIAWSGYQYLHASPGITPAFDAEPVRRVVWSGPVLTGPTVITISWRGVISDRPPGGQLVNEMRVFDFDPPKIIRRTTATSVSLPLAVEFDQQISHPVFAWVNEVLTYTLTFTHAGRSLGPVTISDQLPPAAAWAGGLQASPGISPTYDALNHRLEWSGDILTGATTITLTWRMVAPPQAPPDRLLVNQARAQAAEVDLTRTVTTPVRLPSQIEVAMSASPAAVVPGQPFTYTVTVTNTGGFGYYMRMENYLPAGLTWRNQTAASVNYSLFYLPDERLFIWSAPVITGPSVNTVTWQVSADQGQPGDVIANQADFHDFDPHREFTRTAQVQIVAGPEWATPRQYLPFLLKGFSTKPDLVPLALTVEPAAGLQAPTPVTISLTLQNRGQSQANYFWVDLYLNPEPDPPPNEAGHPWYWLCPAAPCYGLAWYVTTPLVPGQIITLTSHAHEPTQSIWPGSFVTGGPQRLYAYVDSWNGAGDRAGYVLESSEENNRIGPVLLSVGEPAPDEAHRSDPVDLPVRPAPEARSSGD